MARKRRRYTAFNRTIYIRMHHSQYSHAVVSATKNMVRIHYGTARQVFRTEKTKTYFAKSARAAGLWDGEGWDLEKLVRFLKENPPD